MRTLNKKALFEKGKYEYSKTLYVIVDITGGIDTKKYTLRNKSNSDILSKKFQGYELQLANEVE
eukprot:SAG11_NODE_25227_length_361_cov_9.083969_1_plen_63_part_10